MINTQRYQLWPQIIVLNIILSVVFSCLLVPVTWQWLTDWPAFDQHLPVLFVALKRLVIAESQEWLAYREYLEASGYMNDFWLHLLLPVILSSICSIYISFKLLYIPGGRDPEIHIKGPVLLKEKNSHYHARNNYEKEVNSDPIGSGIHIHPSVWLTMRRELGNFFIHGQQGSGKGVVLKPIIKEIVERGDRILIYDEKREYTALFLNNAAVLISPTDERGICWDIGVDVTNNEQALLISECLIPSTSEDEFWVKGSRLIFAGIIIYLMKTHSSWGWEDISMMIDKTDIELKEVLSIYYPPAAKLIEEQSKTTQGFLTIIVTQLSWIITLAKAWPNSDKKGFSITEWVKNKNSAKIIIIPSDPLYSAISGPLCNALLSLITNHVLALPDSNERRIWFALDELGNLPKCESLEKWLSLGRSKGARTIAGTQSISQIYSLYGEQQTETILSLFSNVICLRLGISGSSSKKASDSFGKKTIERAVCTVDQKGNKSTTIQQFEEPIVHPEQIIHLPQANKSGVKGFLCVNGWNAVYQLLWPMPDIKKCADEYVPADWLKPSAKRTIRLGKRGCRGRQRK